METTLTFIIEKMNNVHALKTEDSNLNNRHQQTLHSKMYFLTLYNRKKWNNAGI